MSIMETPFVMPLQLLLLLTALLLLANNNQGGDAASSSLFLPLLVAPSSSSSSSCAFFARSKNDYCFQFSNDANGIRDRFRRLQRRHYKGGGRQFDDPSTTSRLTTTMLPSSSANNNNDSNNDPTTMGNNHNDNNNNESIEDDTKKKISQSELLLELENKLDYPGRISSKSLITSNPPEEEGNDADDELTTDHDDVEGTTVSSTATTMIEHRCALVTILGMPNMGKSTLLNALLSESLAIVAPRPQTTRHAILGVLTAPHAQLCLTDTPGIIGAPAYELQRGMMDAVRGAVRDADVFLVVTDVYSDGGGGGGEKNKDRTTDEIADTTTFVENNGNDLGIGEEMLAKLRSSGKPVIVCVNKVDLALQRRDKDNDNNGDDDDENTPSRAVQTIQKWRSVLPEAIAILPTCAANGPTDPGVVALRSILLANDPSVDVGSAIRNLGRPVPGMFASSNSSSGSNAVLSEEQARKIVPLGPPLYHPDFFTDRTDRFCASELIRETLFQTLGKELPYCCEVRIETFDESRRHVDEERGANAKSSSSSSSKKQHGTIRIGAIILVERDSQKGIVVGKGGTKIKDLGVAARKKLEEFYGVKIFLELRVKVDKNWRNDAEKLKKYGYM